MSATLSGLTVTDICTSPSDTYTVTGSATFTMGSNGKRYDLRLGLHDAATNQVLTSNCFNAPSSANFGNLDGQGDCSDIQNSGTSATGTASFVLPCSINGQPVTSQTATLVIGYAIAPGVTNTSTSPITVSANQTCKSVAGSFDVPFGPVIRLKKLAQGASGSFAFTTTNVNLNPFTLNATTSVGAGAFESASQTLYINGALFNGTSYDASKNITLTETVPASGWDLEGITCATSAGAIGSFNAGSATYTINGGALANNQVIDCVATNAAKSQLSITKAVSNPAGLTIPSANAWTMGFTDGAAIDVTATNTATTPLSQEVRAKTYSITEQLSGNTLAYSVAVSCTGGTYTSQATAVTGGGRVTLGTVQVTGDADVSCTVTNTPSTATLTLAKVVDNGGYTGTAATTDNFLLSYSGAVAGSGKSGASGVTSVTVPVGIYTLAETPDGVPAHLSYTPGLACTGATLSGNQLTLTAGAAAICTFTNTLQTARLTVTKVVEAGGYAGTIPAADDWTLGYAATAASAASVTGTGAGSLDVVVPAGDYTLTEALGGNALGYSVGLSCTDAAVTAGATSVTDGSTVTVGTISIANGATSACTLTNTLSTGSLQLAKSVNHGAATVGLASATDWLLSYAGPASGDMTSGAAAIVVPRGSYAVSEAAKAGFPNTANYSFDDLACTGGALAGSSVTVGADPVVCTFTNTRSTAELTLVKSVVNDNGGTAAADDFTLSYGGTAAAQNTAITVPAGSYALTESTLAGYTPAATPITCDIDTASGSSFAAGSLTLNAGGKATCTFVNEDVAPTYDMAKRIGYVGPLGVGSVLSYEFVFTNFGPWAISDLTPVDTLPGLSPITCPGGGTSVSSLAAGATATCTASYTITQADIDGTGNGTAAGSCSSGFAIINSASSTATETDGTLLRETNAGNNSREACLPVRAPAFSITKDVDQSTLSAPGTLTYTIAVTNTGNVTLTEGALSDSLPVDFGGAAVSGISIPVGGSETWSASHAVDQAMIDAGAAIVNTASFEPAEAEPQSDDATTTISQTPAFTIEKTVDQASLSA
ncbi:beta strand repeat-containing protein, partial [Tabrizicola oligotrophica]